MGRNDAQYDVRARVFSFPLLRARVGVRWSRDSSWAFSRQNARHARRRGRGGMDSVVSEDSWKNIPASLRFSRARRRRRPSDVPRRTTQRARARTTARGRARARASRRLFLVDMRARSSVAVERPVTRARERSGAAKTLEGRRAGARMTGDRDVGVAVRDARPLREVRANEKNFLSARSSEKRASASADEREGEGLSTSETKTRGQRPRGAARRDGVATRPTTPSIGEGTREDSFGRSRPSSRRSSSTNDAEAEESPKMASRHLGRRHMNSGTAAGWIEGDSTDGDADEESVAKWMRFESDDGDASRRASSLAGVSATESVGGARATGGATTRLEAFALAGEYDFTFMDEVRGVRGRENACEAKVSDRSRSRRTTRSMTTPSASDALRRATRARASETTRSAKQKTDDFSMFETVSKTWNVLNSLPSIPEGSMMIRPGDVFSFHDEEPFLSPEWLDRPAMPSAESDNEEDEDEDAARRFTETVRESSFLHLDDDELMKGEIPFDFVNEPDRLSSKRESDVDIDFALASAALLRNEDVDVLDAERECSAMDRDSAHESQEHFATIADGRVFRVSSALVTPTSSEMLAKAKHRLEDSANGEMTDDEDSDADVVAQIFKKDKKRKRRAEETPGRRAKAYKTIKKDKGIRATDVFVLANGKKQRRGCLHCGTVKTPQWRMGPEGKKTLCNACGVRFMKGIL